LLNEEGGVVTAVGILKNMNHPRIPILDVLKGREVSAVTFVRDYLQLQFDGPFLNAFVWPRIKTGAAILDFETPGYRDALCSQIGKTVGGVIEEANRRLSLFFTDGSIIEISLLSRDRRGPEAALLQDGKGCFEVW
jgi:hypothetical protein